MISPWGLFNSLGGKTVLASQQEPQNLVVSPVAYPGKPTSTLSAIDPPIRVLFVDDDSLFGNTTALELEERGFRVRHFANAATFLPALDDADDVDVIILDWHLPKTSGIELLAAIRRRGIKVPVVFLTGRNVIAYENQAFEKGAADFVDKSKGIEVLIRRLKRAALDQAASCVLIQGKLALYRRTSRAVWDGQDLDLTLGEYDIVDILVRHAGNFLTYRAIYDVLRAPGLVAGNGSEGYRANVRSAIKRVRKKFCAVDPQFNEIESYMAFGYRWRMAGD